MTRDQPGPIACSACGKPFARAEPTLRARDGARVHQGCRSRYLARTAQEADEADFRLEAFGVVEWR